MIACEERRMRPERKVVEEERGVKNLVERHLSCEITDDMPT